MLNNHSRTKRIDALFTLYFRCLKRLIIGITKSWATKNDYKSPDALKYANAYCDAQYAFLESIGSFNKEDIFDRFAEFIVILYPQEKVRKLIQMMDDSQLWNPRHLKEQVRFLNLRENTSKAHLKIWISGSKTIRSLFEYSLQILKDPEFEKFPKAEILRTCTEELLK